MFYRKSNESDVFQEITRKMKYGAPELKKLYNVFLIRGLAAAIILVSVIALSSFKYISSHNENAETELIIPVRSIELKDTYVEIPIQEVPVIINQMPLKDLAALTPEPVARRNVKEDVTVKSQDELENVKLPVSSEGTEDVSEVTAEMPGKLDDTKINEQIEKDAVEIKKPVNTPMEIYQVEKQPNALNLNSVKASMDYPAMAISTGTEGRVVVRVLVGTDGSVVKIGSITGPDIFRDEVRQNVMALQFTPAMQNNQTVKCWVSVPFSFELKNR